MKVPRWVEGHYETEEEEEIAERVERRDPGLLLLAAQRVAAIEVERDGLLDAADQVVRLEDDREALRQRVEELERERDAMVEEAADEQTRSIKAALMDEMHDHALTMALAVAANNLALKMEAEVERSHGAILALTGEVERLREALRECVAKRRGDAGPIAASMADARVLDEEVRDYIGRADSAARAALAPEVK